MRGRRAIGRRVTPADFGGPYPQWRAGLRRPSPSLSVPERATSARIVRIARGRAQLGHEEYRTQRKDDRGPLQTVRTHRPRARSLRAPVVGCFRRRRVSLSKWADREIRSKTEASIALDELRAAVRAGTFDERGLRPRPQSSSLTFRQFADIYIEKHARAKSLSLADRYQLPPEALARAVRGSSTCEHPNRGHRGLRRGPQETTPGERPAGAPAGAGVHQPLPPTAAPHVQLGGRP